MSAPSLHVRGLAIVTAGVFILSFDALLVRLAGATPADFGFWRGMFICMSLLTLLVAGGLGRVNVRPVGGYLLAGTVAGIGLVLFPFSIMNTHTANTVVILTSAPFFAAIFSRVFLAEPIARRTWVAIGIVMVGLAVIFAGSVSTTGRLGDALALAAAITFGVNMTLLRSMRELSRTAVTCLSGLVACLLCAPFADPLTLSTATMGYIAVAGLVQMPAAMVMISVGTRFLPAPEVSLLILIETLLAPIWVYLVFAERPTATTVYAGTVILVTLLIHSWLGLRAERAQRPATFR